MKKEIGAKDCRIYFSENSIYINNQAEFREAAMEIEWIFTLDQAVPEMRVYEDSVLVNNYKIETVTSNPDLTGQYFHTSVRILQNSAVMIDGIISTDPENIPKWSDRDCEGIRFQPFFLSNNPTGNEMTRGRGLFDRGLHFSGTVTPGGVRNICICDDCKLSFAIQHFHAGFSESQYFYSSDSRETLVVPNRILDDLPFPWGHPPNEQIILQIERLLPSPSNGSGTFNYYNSFRCPHCFSEYISLGKYKELRSTEYYGNTYLNQSPVYCDVLSNI
jgi:hypothetical protein